MTQSSSEAFRTVMRGYDPAEVDQRLAELTAAAETAARQVAELTGRVEELTSCEAAARQAAVATSQGDRPDFSELGVRIGQILTLAHEEA